MDLLVDVVAYVYLDNPKTIGMYLVMSNKTSMSMIASTCFYSNVPPFSTTSTKIYLSKPFAL